MALSAFGDEIDDEPSVMSSQPVPATAPAPKAVSAFGDALDDDDAQADMPNRTVSQWVTDVGGSVGRGAYNLFDAGAGLGDILTGGEVTPWLAEHGLDSKAARQILDDEMSPQAKAQRGAVQSAQGFLPTAAAMLQNPAYAAGQVIESVPTMAVGGLAGKGAALGASALGLNAGGAALVGAGVGEGLATAGQQAAQTVQQTGGLTAGQTAAALGSGALTGLIGAGSAGLGGRFGAADIDALLAGAAGPATGRGMLGRMGIGAGMEAGEEALQSSQEQIMQNAALGNPLTQGVGNAAGQGAVLGGFMGGAGGLRRPNVSTPQAVPMPTQQQQGMQQPQSAPLPTPSPAAAASAAQIAPQEPVAAVAPFAGSQDINPLLDNLGVQGEARATSLDLLRPAEADIEARRRGVVTLEEQRRLARLIGIEGSDGKIDNVFSRKIGKAFNAEEIIAMTDHVSDRLKSVLEQQAQITSGQASDIQRAEFVQGVADLQSTFGALAGARAESGRALAAQRRQVFDYRQAQHILEGIGGVQGADNLALALSKAVQSGGVANASKLIANRKPGLFDYYFRAALLSGVRTHAVNILSNTLTLGNEMIERGVAAGVGGAKRALTGGKSGETLFAEPLDLLIGSAKGMTKAGVAAYDAFKSGESPMLGVGKAESGVGIRPTQGIAEKAFSLPYRALGAEDAWFATLNYEGELRTLARHQAIEDRKSGALPQDMKLSQRIEQLVQNPTSNMIEKAGEHARTNTFNNKAGAFAQAIMSAKAKAPWLNIIVPFVRTPANIVKFGLKRTPFALAFADVRADLKAGGAKQERAIARILWGSSVMVGAGALAQAGYLTGAGPEDKEEKASLMATGWRPYSIKVGDTYREYSRLDPFAQWLSMAADLATNDYQHKDAGDIAAGLLGSFANATINKTYMQGLSNFSEFLSDPKRNGGWYLRQQAGTLAQPFTLASNIASENDPYARESSSVLDAIKYRVPGLRQDLPVRLDHFGEPIPNRTYPGGPLSIAAPIAQSKETTDSVRLEASRIGWAPGKTQGHFTIKKQRYDLSDEQMSEFNELAGKLTHKSAQRAMQSKGWAALGDDEKRDFLDAELKKARTAVRLAFIPYLANGNRRAVDNLRRATGQQEGK
ncbi:hypothetical protein HUS95_20675 [Pseudomonas chlororaphis]|uniref:hypothetical protein n=1 Tax=Pseudomonas chlororaphis TaxID=587753 RepID=UPI001B30E918|nr:hypothetical protein [Pseudomonas chlororaphis]MBP5057598.1 hypothetical protein [Pseudomonas chlororaphis]QTT99114.1 hypothetical protein HUT26_07480 [Pseudomonas chlororaphis]